MVSMILLTAAAGASGAIMRVPRSAATMASTRMVRTSVAMARNRSGGAQLCANEAPANDHALSAISADGSISAKAVVTTELVAEAARLQGLGGLATAALGRALTCSLLVAEGLKDGETFQVKFDGDGPLRGVLAVANGMLESRGYVGNPAVTLPPNAKGKIDVGGGVGRGTLQVVRTKMIPGVETPAQYSSITDIRSGEIPEDINYYLLESEQRQGALAAGVFVKGDDTAAPLPSGVMPVQVVASGGWYVQLLPFAAEEAIGQLEANLAEMQSSSPSSMVRQGLGARGMLEGLLKGLDPQFTEERGIPSLADSCPCSEERLLRTLRLLPRPELDDIVEKNEVVEAKCEFCATLYRMTPDEIRKEIYP
uniref:Uncharacterized protein n=1 Tax=Chrysotila carterae TaxID=13221 RepID=A0A7S4BLH2_CHRCT|mmetsp:Transcript_1192/g.2440  ORF Transcript_1192/g.2440 Transcript_1192/m.2440 type:complete len:367 (+) Transcript_1192:114-1214(+)